MQHDGRSVRCAIYTRKSTDEGLEQEFNSLDAQREACAAYILSQKHEGWTSVSDSYDDGGFSGGTLERPALKRLLKDVEAGKVDVIVVYKVDRLTRALSDFARIVEVLDGRNASFVSVTQAFNTTTSMGRLTLNVLLSFAQFEREVTGERIRDKIAASKRKGMWMGGPVPIGYEVKDRKLVVHDAEAKVVRHIFRRYLELGSGQSLLEELRRDGYRTKVRTQGNRLVGGIPFERGTLFALLGNRLYLGETKHKGDYYPGEHEAIIDRELWDAVQNHIASQRVGRRAPRNSQQISLLAGMLFDAQGRRMSPSHTSKGGKRYRYYITHGSEVREGSPPAARIPAQDVEAAVIDQLRRLVDDQRRIHDLVMQSSAGTDGVTRAIGAARTMAERMDTPARRRAIVMAVVTRVQLSEQSLSLHLDMPSLMRRLGIDTCNAGTMAIEAPAMKIRSGKETKLVIAGADVVPASRDNRLVSLIAEAHAARAMVLASPEQSLTQIAREHRQCRKRLAQLLRISWLAPDLVQSAILGTQPAALTAPALLTINLSEDWSQQRGLFCVA